MDNVQNIIYFISFLIILSIIIYSSNVLRLQTSNCKKIATFNITKVNAGSLKLLTNINDRYNRPINEFFIKTAYNCCCTGKFKNDFVDTCALKNCMDQGARALHFEIFSLNNYPIIATSTTNIENYKETYNYLDMAETMSYIKKLNLNNS
jgi:hypothetical protein